MLKTLTQYVPAADFSFEGLNFSAKNSHTDFPVYLKKKKKKKHPKVVSSLKCCSSFFKICCILLATVPIANMLAGQGGWCVRKAATFSSPI